MNLYYNKFLGQYYQILKEERKPKSLTLHIGIFLYKQFESLTRRLCAVPQVLPFCE